MKKTGRKRRALITLAIASRSTIGWRAPGDRRLGAHPLGGGGGPRQRRPELVAPDAGPLGLGGGVLHLAEDLGLAHHHRVEAGGDPEEVPERRLVLVDEGVRRRQRTERG